MNGRNGNVLEGYYRNRNKPNWSLVVAICAVLLGLLGALYNLIERNTDLKIENTNLKFRNEMQKQIIEHRYVPNSPYKDD